MYTWRLVSLWMYINGSLPVCCLWHILAPCFPTPEEIMQLCWAFTRNRFRGMRQSHAEHCWPQAHPFVSATHVCFTAVSGSKTVTQFTTRQEATNCQHILSQRLPCFCCICTEQQASNSGIAALAMCEGKALNMVTELTTSSTVKNAAVISLCCLLFLFANCSLLSRHRSTRGLFGRQRRLCLLVSAAPNEFLLHPSITNTKVLERMFHKHFGSSSQQRVEGYFLSVVSSTASCSCFLRSCVFT